MNARNASYPGKNTSLPQAEGSPAALDEKSPTSQAEELLPAQNVDVRDQRLTTEEIVSS
jgi:hypothetical protein